MENYPAIGITLGDPGGIGPEVILKALRGRRSISARLVVFGSVRVLNHHSRVLNLPFPGKSIKVIDIDNVTEPYFGPNPPLSGQCSIDYLDAAFQSYARGEIHALVTGPIHKESWHAAGYRYPGQTEYCALKTGSVEYCMLMVSDRFRIAVLSTHLSLRDAITQLTEEELARKIRLLDREFRNLGWPQPQIACAALNPHAGEGGAFGSEEQAVMIPLLDRLRSEGIAVEGPFAPEVIFRVAAHERKWDVVLAMYHDQAMIPLKLLDFERSANVTLGLPLIRTSPDHGTAFDIAGKGVADPGSMKYALRLAADWTCKRLSNR